MACCYLALGGNLGPVAETFREALASLPQRHITVTAVSSNHRTAPVGVQAGGDFVNAAARIETTLAPLELLDQLQAVESDFGRDRTLHWGPRPLDLDILFYANEVFSIPRLAVPHPALWYRRFVLDPLAEIAPDFIHPVKRVTIRELRERLLRRPLPVRIVGLPASHEAALIAELTREFPAAEIGEAAQPGEPSAGVGPALLVWFGPPTGNSESFEDLPLLPRYDASASPQDPLSLMRDLLRAALGE